MALGSLLVSVRASAAAYDADVKSIQRSSQGITRINSDVAQSATGVVNAWKQTRDAANDAMRKMQGLGNQKTPIDDFRKVTTAAAGATGLLASEAEDAGKKISYSFIDANLAARALGNTIGVHLPREITRLLAESATIGPVLAASFHVVALFGFIEILKQIPEMFDKMKAAVTGWDDAAKKAYEHQIDLNQRYLRALQDIELEQVKALEQMGKITAGESIKRQIDDVTKSLTEQQKHWVEIQNQINRIKTAEAEAAKLQASHIYVPLPGGASVAELTEQLKRAQEEIDKTQQTLLDLRKQTISAGVQDAKQEEDLAKQRKETAQDYRDFWLGALQEFRNRSVSGNQDVIEGLKEADRQAKVIVSTYQFWEKELERIRVGQGAVADAVKEMESGTPARVKAIIESMDYWNKAFKDWQKSNFEMHQEEIKESKEASTASARQYSEAYKKAFQEVKSAAGHIFDDMVTGQGFNIIKAAGLTLARDLYSSMAAEFLTPLKQELDKIVKSISRTLSNAITGALGDVKKQSDKESASGGGLGSSLLKGGIFAAVTFGVGSIVSAISDAFGKGRKEADRFVQAIQNPFGTNVKSLFDSLTEARNMGTLTVSAVSDARRSLEDMWAAFLDAANQAEYGVGQQAIAGLRPLMDQWRLWLNGLSEAGAQLEHTAAVANITKQVTDAAKGADILEEALHQLVNMGTPASVIVATLGGDISTMAKALQDSGRPISTAIDLFNQLEEHTQRLSDLTTQLQDATSQLYSLQDQRASLQKQIRDVSNNLEKSRLQGVIDTTSDLKTYYRAQEDMANLNARLQQEAIQDQQDQLAALQAELAATDDAIYSQRIRIALIETEQSALRDWIDAANSANTSLSGLVETLNHIAGPGISTIVPSYQSGIDYVPTNQLAFLHAGERVVPANDNASTAGSVTVHLTVNGSVVTDKQLAKWLQEEMARNVQNYGQRPASRQIGVRSNRY